jgi:hypothetical protein
VIDRPVAVRWNRRVGSPVVQRVGTSCHEATAARTGSPAWNVGSPAWPTRIRVERTRRPVGEPLKAPLLVVLSSNVKTGAPEVVAGAETHDAPGDTNGLDRIATGLGGRGAWAAASIGRSRLFGGCARSRGVVQSAMDRQAQPLASAAGSSASCCANSLRFDSWMRPPKHHHGQPRTSSRMIVDEGRGRCVASGVVVSFGEDDGEHARLVARPGQRLSTTGHSGTQSRGLTSRRRPPGWREDSRLGHPV